MWKFMIYNLTIYYFTFRYWLLRHRSSNFTERLR